MPEKKEKRLESSMVPHGIAITYLAPTNKFSGAKEHHDV